MSTLADRAERLAKAASDLSDACGEAAAELGVNRPVQPDDELAKALVRALMGEPRYPSEHGGYDEEDD